ncbi:hypothetical protein N7489_001289 [Penicillium chrysogenum]|uniref:uncharacterized protein n=1 Tax=Penicillium chrysogenum TaxID=5076 RepID=UPI0024DF22C4|nr:uncharacterized protein N7489_001289 [Penicillium chrysogenum]KAJ5250879.1 hypothetical protein N7489_001289 [Penicillium chrysogenum]
MSGLEVVGVVASILQIADVGAKLSVKLCTFYQTVKVANQSMQDLSCDVSLTCSILNELAKALEQDDQAKLCSEQAFCIAQEVLQECKAQFGEAQVDHVADVTCYHVCGELRRRKVKSTLIDQRNLIQTLLEEKKANTSKFDQLSRSIQTFSICDDDGSRQESSRSFDTENQLPPLSMELRRYHTLVQKLLYEIDACQDSLEESRHLRIRNGVVNVHTTEAVLFQRTHGRAATQIFDDPFFKFRDACFPAPVTVTTREQSLRTPEAQNAYSRPRESDYDIVRRSDIEEDPGYYRRYRRVREYDRPSRRKLDQDYSSDDSMAYIPKETRHYEDYPHHRRHMAERALVDADATEFLRSRSKKDGEVSQGDSRIGKIIEPCALRAVAVNPASDARDYYRRGQRRRRSYSFEYDRSSHRHSRHGRGPVRRQHGRGPSRSRSRSHSHARAKTLRELGLDAQAMAAGTAALRSKANTGDRKSRSRTHSRSRAFSRGRSEKDGEKDDSAHSMPERHKLLPGAGLASRAIAALDERAHSRLRSRVGEQTRSESRLKQDLPIVSSGVPTAAAAAATGLSEDSESQEDEKDGISRGHRSRSRSPAASQFYPDPSRSSAGLIEYGVHPVTDSIPAKHYRPPVSPGGSDDASDTYGRRSTRSRSRSRGGGRYSSSSGSDGGDRSRSREIPSAALGATGLGYAARKYSQQKDRRRSEGRELLWKKEKKKNVMQPRLADDADSYPALYKNPDPDTERIGIAGLEVIMSNVADSLNKMALHISGKM